MKKIIFTLIGLLLASGFTANAADSFTLGACGHKIAGGNGYGSDTAGEIAAALYVPASKLQSLAGNYISRVDVGLISRINVRELNIWVRKDLNGADLATGYIERGILGWNEVTLNEPYLIENDSPGLYIGFSYANAGSSHPVSFIGDAGDYTCWARSSAGGKWEDMTAKGALSLEAIVTGASLPQYDLALLSGTISPDPASGEGIYTVAGSVSNEAMKKVSGFYVTLSAEGYTGPEREVKLDVEPGEKKNFVMTYEAGAKLSGDVTVTVSGLIDGKDANPANNSIASKVAFVRNVLFEEFTTEMCSNCPGAAEEINSLMKKHNHYDGRVIMVCHHSAFYTDHLTRDCDTDLVWMFNGSPFAPSAMFDRQPIFMKGLNKDRLEPIVGIRSGQDVEDCIEEAMKQPTHAVVGVKVVSSDDNTAVVEVSILTDDEFSLSNPILTFYALEDNLKAIRQSGAESAFTHNHVIRYDNGGWGEPVAFEDNAFSKRFTIDLDPSWKREDLGFVAFLSERDEENVNNNVVENTAFTSLIVKNPDAGITDAEVNADAYPVAYYDLTGRRLDSCPAGVAIIVFSDGSAKKILNLAN